MNNSTNDSCVVTAEATHCPWTAEDAAAIKDYSGYGSTTINEALRANECEDFVQERVVAVSKALAKFKVFKGQVYRGTSLDVLPELKVGVEFQDSAFFSTTRARKRAMDKECLLKIKSRTGIDIMKHAELRKEQEVVFPPGTRFLITSVMVDKDDKGNCKTIVDMEEMEK